MAMALSGGPACAPGPNPRLAAPLVPADRPYVRDLPLPRGFRLVDQSSEDWSGGALRYVRHQYRGGADRHGVRAFYADQMPLARWTPISDRQADGTIVMRFQKNQEACTITIEDKGAGRSRECTVTAVIVPERTE
ncbi:MAG: hypothetical protein IIB61_08880 [Planctomycetes bacterium]|nr:hypothetical protein [Planctomycetota bacterium]